jgi:hemerythrin superfamily protein
MDIPRWIHEEHERFKVNLADVVKTPGDQLDKRNRLFDKAIKGLDAHGTAEEEVLFSAMQENVETRVGALDSLEWHKSIRRVMRELIELDHKDELWPSKMRLVQGMALAHFKAEESALRPIQKAFKPKKLDELLVDFQTMEKGILDKSTEGPYKMASRLVY